MKNKAADKVGFYHVNINLEDTISEDALMEEVNKLNNDDRIHGILVQLPLPKHIDAEKILRNIKVSKDADGFSALKFSSRGVPVRLLFHFCTESETISQSSGEVKTNEPTWSFSRKDLEMVFGR